MSVRKQIRTVVVIAVLLTFAAACEPGWVNPAAGSGDGAGTVPGTTEVANDQVAFASPSAVVAIPGGGFYVYDQSECAIYKVATATTLYAGTPGTCGHSGDGGPATSAQIDAHEYITEMPVAPMMALGRDGALYLAGDQGQVLRRIDAVSGVISSITLPVDLSSIVYLTGLAADTDGTLYFQTCQPSSHQKLYRLADDGTATEIFDFTGVCWDRIANAGPGTFVAIGNVGENKWDAVRIDVVAKTLSDTGVEASRVTASVDGTIYAVTPGGNQLIRIDADNTSTVIAGTGEPDPGTGRPFSIGSTMRVTPNGLAVTPHGHLLFSSGHVVYHLHDPAHAGTPAA